ncbi:AfsR/SARP family transcriptional regulator [Goodfellowiella coeruleoviolacea]|uniref:AfsR/SARP family transcriptional regulator n=1 Tax=Goodfellowiella coeruleoviolacea TaxID=334858 RepID=UPI0027DF289D|nr:BTAD domain-containing putative transcriptional regulator [Goodfellowiella coeruleoviolacea]
MEFGVLGPVEARLDGQDIDLGHARQRCVLAILLVDANQTLSLDQLADRVWGERQPDRASGTLRSYLSRLRTALSVTTGCALVRRSGGYALLIDEDAIDLHRFRRLLAEARSSASDEHAAGLFAEALALWRGEPFAGLDTLWLAEVRDAVRAEHFAAVLDHNDIRLRRGEHAALLTELARHADRHPLDERLAGQLMLAHYRAGRQADALQHYQRIRRRLAEDLGTDPCAALQRLHQHILTADRALALPAATGSTAPVPRQLPAAPALFTGRAAELAALSTTLGTSGDAARHAVTIAVVGGTGGIGKTALALHWAHQNLARFPDGQLYVNLRGFDPAGEPVPSSAAVHGFLIALGVAAEGIPADADAQAALYRSLVADRRMLVVLDNALDTAQVLPLLPGSPSCAVLVTSRGQLPGLVTNLGARVLPLDVLSAAEAEQLLTARLGPDRVAAEPEATAELLGHCAGFPLALSIAAGRAALQPGMPLAALAEELRETATRLRALDTGDLHASLRAVFSWSHAALDTDVATAFQLLGLAPGPDISLPAAASLIGTASAHTRELLRDLERVSLVHQHAPERYRVHDLVRLYAAERAAAEQAPQDRQAALRRLVDHYLHTAYHGEQVLGSHGRQLDLDPPARGCAPTRLTDEPAALAWFTAEHPHLLAVQRLAAQHGWHTAAWQLAWAQEGFHWRRSHLRDHLAVWQVGLDATRALGDATAQAWAHQCLGHAHTRLGGHAEALHHLDRALALTEQVNDVPGHAGTHLTLTMAHAARGDDQRALDHAQQALRLFRTLGNQVWEAHALNLAGRHHARLGQYDAAHAACTEALALFRRHQHRFGEAATLDSLGFLAHASGAHAAALEHYQQALALRREVGATYQLADTLYRLGEAHAAQAEHGLARVRWQQALDLYRAQHRAVEADQARRRLAELDERTDRGRAR